MQTLTFGNVPKSRTSSQSKSKETSEGITNLTGSFWIRANRHETEDKDRNTVRTDLQTMFDASCPVGLVFAPLAQPVPALATSVAG
jgi:hypothetical protein